jgi:hypothetical protein
MVLDDWDAADKRLRAFFRLVKRVEELEPSEAQRDEWEFDSDVTIAAWWKNFCWRPKFSLLAHASGNWNLEGTSPSKLMPS